MKKLSVPEAVSTYQMAFVNVPLQETLALPVTCVQPEVFTVVLGARVRNVFDPFTVNSRVMRACGLFVIVLTQAVEVKVLPLVSLEVTFWLMPLNDAVRPVSKKEWVPLWA